MWVQDIWDRNKIVVDNVFSFKVAIDITKSYDLELEPQSIEECWRRNDWPMWLEAIQAKLNSFEKREIFGPIVQTLDGVVLVRYKWVFVWKHNEKNEITRCKAWLVAKGFSQRPGIDYKETYASVMDAITFRFFILGGNIKFRHAFNGCVTTYLYGSLDNDIYMKIPKWYKMPEAYDSISRSMYSIKLQMSLSILLYKRLPLFGFLIFYA